MNIRRLAVYIMAAAAGFTALSAFGNRLPPTPQAGYHSCKSYPQGFGVYNRIQACKTDRGGNSLLVGDGFWFVKSNLVVFLDDNEDGYADRAFIRSSWAFRSTKPLEITVDESAPYMEKAEELLQRYFPTSALP
jgi:hypothetical protein